ncbi:MAG TPA: RelA/SpoT domain-containing protein, partial [Acidimicrobiales bacterium]|nr:RelA/SpoT domain-containing protein [Acidimicrobiales bacterium]
KDTQRAWKKLQKPQYRSLASDIMNVPEILDDLVGVRIVCNNLSDIQRVKEIIGSLPEFDPDSLTGLAIEGESERFYLDAPKPSGYRAYHINLVTVVPGSDHVHPMRAELQVRTLLQDGWGELTHEDTYKAVQSSRLLR